MEKKSNVKKIVLPAYFMFFMFGAWGQSSISSKMPQFYVKCTLIGMNITDHRDGIHPDVL
jgi:hypothetical protein